MTNLTTSAAPTSTTARGTVRTLLTCGAAAGPLYVAVAAAQALARDGFDIRRHPVSLLSNGDLGWIQITNFTLAGLLTVAGAVGMRRALGTTGGGVWGPRLVGVYGASLVAAGALVADPALGFPVGSPAGQVAMSWHGAGHFAAGGIGFFALIAACLVFARRFATAGARGWAVWSAATGVGFLAAFAGIASGGGSSALNIAFTVAVVAAWTWLTALALHVRARHAR